MSVADQKSKRDLARTGCLPTGNTGDIREYKRVNVYVSVCGSRNFSNCTAVIHPPDLTVSQTETRCSLSPRLCLSFFRLSWRSSLRFRLFPSSPLVPNSPSARHGIRGAWLLTRNEVIWGCYRKESDNHNNQVRFAFIVGDYCSPPSRLERLARRSCCRRGTVVINNNNRMNLRTVARNK